MPFHLAVSLGSGGPAPGFPRPGEQLESKQQAERGGEEEEEEEAGWLLFCFGHTHTLLISNDGKGNTQ